MSTNRDRIYLRAGLALLLAASAAWGASGKQSSKPSDKLPGAEAGQKAGSLAEAQATFERGDHATAISLAREEVKLNPGHEEAYLILAQALEAKGDKAGAAEAWGQLRVITRVPERIQQARLGLLRTKGPDVPKFTGEGVWEDDPYKVDIGEVPWDRLKAEVDGVQVQYVNEMPPVAHESNFFVVLACTQRAAEVITHLCEKYTNFLLQKYFHAGQEWALRIPIIVFKNHEDYVNVGKLPAQSAGLTRSDAKTGVPIMIALYMLDEDGKLDHEALEGTLPHELTHMVIHEWFGGQDVPRWIDEGLARRMEQTRKHYEEAAKVGRDAVAGEFYQFRALFEQEQYPARGDRVWRFYEQSATIVLFLLEQYGPESAVAFFETLRQGKSHDDAVAAALGISPEVAVDEFERRWVDWIRKVYVARRQKIDGDAKAEGKAIENVAVATFDELASAAASKKWTPVKSDDMKAFRDIGGSLEDWKSEGGKLVFAEEGRAIGSMLAMRFDVEPPFAFKCKVRATKASFEKPARLGLTMLDHRADDTGIQVIAPLEDKRPRDLVCVVTDEIALYLDGLCVGRAPAFDRAELNEDIDWPLALVGYDAVEVSDIQVTLIEKFEPLKPPAQPDEGGEAKQP